MSTQLCINISRTSAHFAEVLRSTSSLIREATLTFSSLQGYAIKDELKTFMQQEAFLKEYDEYSLAFWGEKFTVVPFNLFDSKNYTDVFNLCFGKGNFNNDELDYTMQPHLGVTSIYEIPNWIKSFFIVKFPRIIIQHGISLQLNGMNNESNFKPNLHVHIEQDYFYMTLFKHTNLIFSNSFDYQNEDDITYHLVHVLKKMQVISEEGQINISGKNNTLDVAQLINTLNAFSELKQFKKQLAEERIIKHHLLCV